MIYRLYMAKRGRPPRPPRTDPNEIEKSHLRLDEDIQRRMLAVMGPMPEPDPTSRLLQELVKHSPKSGSRVAIEEDEAHNITVKRSSITELLEPPAVLTDEQREARLAESRAAVAADESAATRRRSRRRPLDLKTQVDRILPRFPQSIRDAAFDSIIYLYDEAPESMRAQLPPALLKVHEQLVQYGMPEKVAKQWNMVRCAAWAEGNVRDPGPNGHRAALIHYRNVEHRMKKFAATCEMTPDGRVKIPRDVVLRLFAPAFNAVNAAQRVCLECGTIFALRNDHERMNMKFCGGAKKCGKKVSSRKAKVAARAAGDTYTKVREAEKGDLALGRAERELAIGTNIEEVVLDLVDAGRKVRDKK